MSHKNSSFVLLVTLLTLLFSDLSAYAVDDRSSRRTLTGVGMFYVLVEQLPPSIQREGLKSKGIREVVEQKLRIAGIPFLTEKEMRENPPERCIPYLYVLPIILKTKFGDNYFYYINIEFCQNATLTRDPSIVADTCTWSNSLTGISPFLSSVRSHTATLLDTFIKAYLSVNEQ